jgi:hypothetical protein
VSFWTRTLKIFESAPVRVEYRGGALGKRVEIIAEIESIGDASCSLKKADGTLLILPFKDILVVEPAVGRL